MPRASTSSTLMSVGSTAAAAGEVSPVVESLAEDGNHGEQATYCRVQPDRFDAAVEVVVQPHVVPETFG